MELRFTTEQFKALCNVLVWADLYDQTKGGTNEMVYDRIAEAVPYRERWTA